MNIIQLNEEIALNDGNGSAVILMVDYKHNSFDIFKTYEDKTFSSADIQKHFEIIKLAYELGKQKLHPDLVPRVRVKHEAVQSELPKKLKAITKQCKQCGNDFTCYSNRSTLCPECKSIKP